MITAAHFGPSESTLSLSILTLLRKMSTHPGTVVLIAVNLSSQVKRFEMRKDPQIRLRREFYDENHNDSSEK